MTVILILVGTCVALIVLMYLPNILSAVIDPRNIKIIIADCAAKGYENVRVKLWPNHYGVHFTANGKKHYATCKVEKGAVKWKAPKQY